MTTLEPDESARAFEGIVPVLMGVLGRLASQGYSYPSSDALDILHDFYLDEWGAVLRSFNPEKGPLSRYAGRAFARYARRWLRRGIRLQNTYGEAAAALYEPAEPKPVMADLKRVRRALEALPAQDRVLLLQRFAVNPVSEREMASELGRSRHHVRERLLACLSELAIRVGDGLAATNDGRVLNELFVGKTPIPWIARKFGLTETQVRRMRRGFLQTVSKALRDAAP